MKGYMLNPDKEYVNKIIEGIYRKDGHCPCRLNVYDTTLCPCDEFVQKQVCKCNLFVLRQKDNGKEEKKKKNI